MNRIQGHKKPVRRLAFGCTILLAILFLFTFSSKTYAQLCVPPAFCDSATLLTNAQFTRTKLSALHRIFEAEMAAAFAAHREWLTGVFFPNYIKPAMQGMTQQLTAVSMQQAAMIGMFLDAKQQLETQRLFQELQAEAHRDYQPSEDFCWFGTAARSMAATESAGKFHAAALNARQMKRHLRHADIASSSSLDKDKKARWDQFVKNYCDPADNNMLPNKTNGLTAICPKVGPRPNMDIDFTRLIDERRTLDVSFDPSKGATPDEQDVLALGNNLYGSDVIGTVDNLDPKTDPKAVENYMALRAVAAKRNVAENSFNSIVALKSSGTDLMMGASKTSAYLGAILAELGVPEGEISAMIGEKPSYYAQLEILAKKIYQNPDFFANLYDTPANVARKSVALKAIELMLDRAIYESQMRQEMVMSVLMSARLQGEFDRTRSKLSTGGERQ